MPDYRRRNCLLGRGGCGKPDTEVGPITWGGLCMECAHRKLNASIEEQHAHEGPTFQLWRRGMAACVGAVVLDDIPREPYPSER